MKKKRAKIFSISKFLTFFSVIIFFFFLAHIFSAKIERAKILQELETQINAEAADFSGKFSLSIYRPGFWDLEFEHESDQRIAAASIIKIPILAVALKAVREEKITLKDRVTVNPSEVVGGSGILRRIDLPIELTFEGLLIYMMAISDNTATNKVIDLLGFDYINNVFAELGLDSTVLARKMMDFKSRSQGVENYTSSRDLASLLKKIYYNQLFDEESSKQAKRILLFQQHRDRIPLLLPENTSVAHKTGLERGVLHDAGIVYGENSDFIIAVLTRDVTSFGEAKKFIAQISYLAYNLLN